MALENIAGTTPAAALTTASNANVLLLSAEASLEAEQIDKDYIRTTLTKLKQGIGQKTGGVTATFELAGTSAGTYAAGAPVWSRFLEMSGFQRKSISSVAIGVITGGPFRKGEYVNDGTNNFKVAMDTHKGDTVLYFETNGALAITTPAYALTGTDTGATVTATADSIANVGYAWSPVSDVIKQVTLGAAASAVLGDVYKAAGGAVLVVSESTSSSSTLYFRPGNAVALVASETLTRVSGTGPTTLTVHATPAEQFVKWPTGSIRLNEDGVALDFVGSRSNAAFEFTVNRPVQVTCTTRGLWSAAADVVFVTGAAPDIVDAPLWAGTAVGMALNEDAEWTDVADEVSPCLRSLSLDMGVQLSDHQCASATDGLLEVVGTSRDSTATLSGDAMFEGEFPWLAKLRDGEVTRLRVTVGTTAGNKFVLHMPGLQATSASSGDQDGILTRDISANLTGGVNNNLAGAASPPNIGESGEDNELVLIYLTA